MAVYGKIYAAVAARSVAMHKFEDFLEDDSRAAFVASSQFIKTVHTCPLGDDCNHGTADECDEYRQKLLDEDGVK